MNVVNYLFYFINLLKLDIENWDLLVATTWTLRRKRQYVQLFLFLLVVTVELANSWTSEFIS